MLAKAYSELTASNQALFDKFKAYLDASNYDGKKDFKKWLGELVTAMNQLEKALSHTRDKLDAMKKALNDYVKQQVTSPQMDPDAAESIARAMRVMGTIKMNIDSIQTHVDKYKA